MNIEWTLCSERMPPDDRDSIVKNYDGSFKIVGLYKSREFVILSRSKYWYVSAIINPDESHANHQPEIFRNIADKLDELNVK